MLTTTPVGIYPAGVSPSGVFDCAGNVWEWGATRWRKDYPYDVEENEWTKKYFEKTSVQTLRGGSWIDSNIEAVRCAFRFRYGSDGRLNDFGFRLQLAPHWF